MLGAAASPAPADTDTPASSAAPKNGADAADAGEDKADKAETEAAKPERLAPEAYELKAPKGTTLDAEARTEFEAIARELKMPQAEAQALVERMAPKLQQRFAAQQAEVVARASSDWTTAVKADKELGGEALPENLAAAARAMKHFGTPELALLLEDSRLGNHPEVVRFMTRAGKAMAEDKFIAGRAPVKAKTTAQVLYPNNA